MEVHFQKTNRQNTVDFLEKRTASASFLRNARVKGTTKGVVLRLLNHKNPGGTINRRGTVELSGYIFGGVLLEMFPQCSWYRFNAIKKLLSFSVHHISSATK